jgi:hypothetical protein
MLPQLRCEFISYANGITKDGLDLSGREPPKIITRIVIYSILFNAASGRLKSSRADNLRVKVVVESRSPWRLLAMASGAFLVDVGGRDRGVVSFNNE